MCLGFPLPTLRQNALSCGEIAPLYGSPQPYDILGVVTNYKARR